MPDRWQWERWADTVQDRRGRTALVTRWLLLPLAAAAIGLLV